MHCVGGTADRCKHPGRQAQIYWQTGAGSLVKPTLRLQTLRLQSGAGCNS
ncbi:hypothetical protein DIPPA_24142 [Diplonema papillatum]|nr:hypothetical protein DIPPA_24142 [Diplonema papillatum]